MVNSTFVEVAVPLALRSTFTYIVDPSKHTNTPAVGSRVRINFRHREIIGIITKVCDKSDLPSEKVKEISEILDDTPIVNEELLSLCHWSATYYHHPVGEVIFSALPANIREGKPLPTITIWQLTHEGKGLPDTALKRAKKQQHAHQYLLEHSRISETDLDQANLQKQTLKALVEKGLVESIAVPLSANPKEALDTKRPEAPLLNQTPLVLTDEQETAVTSIKHHQFGCYLLEGITGSGKTEVYLHIIARTLQAGKQALVLIPEIGLSPQTFSRFTQRFNTKVCELHSNMSESKRTQNWLDAKNGHARIIVGTRLASLVPMADLGVIIIDEEHDRSYKQQDSFKYSARNISIYRANKLNIPIVLGSATPSLETYLNATQGKYSHLTLKNRAGAALPPEIIVNDLRNQQRYAGLSELSLAHCRKHLNSGKQALIFVNRRGYAPALICHTCGWCAQCRYCDTKMTVHHQPAHLRCHHCDRQNSIPKHCPECRNPQFVTTGLGTEQTEHFLNEQFPDIDVIRIDRDATSTRMGLQEKLSAAFEDKPCIFVGTQMLAKGHHLPNLKVVVIVDADQGLMSPDFRGLEQAGQLITQVSGRSGREDERGEVIIQTYNPEHPLLEKLLSRGYPEFAKQILKQRQAGRLPPYWHLTTLRAESKRATNAVECLAIAKRTLHNLNISADVLQVVGPSPAPIERINDRYRYVLQIKSLNRKVLHQSLFTLIKDLEAQPIAKRCRWAIDVDSVQD